MADLVNSKINRFHSDWVLAPSYCIVKSILIDTDWPRDIINEWKFSLWRCGVKILYSYPSQPDSNDIIPGMDNVFYLWTVVWVMPIDHLSSGQELLGNVARYTTRYDSFDSVQIKILKPTSTEILSASDTWILDINDLECHSICH